MTNTPYAAPEGVDTGDSPSSLSILTNLISAPDKAFKQLKVDYPVALPLVTVIGLNALVIILLYANIDYEWLIEHMVNASAGDTSNAEKDQMRQGLEMMSPTMMGGFGAVGVALVLTVIFCVYAVYLVIVSNINNDGFQFKQWLSFTCWCSIPSLVGTLASLVVVLTNSNGQMAPESINPLTLNELFFGLNALEGAGSILATIDLAFFWSIALMTYGYSKWTEKNMISSSLIIVSPYILIFGVRFMFA